MIRFLLVFVASATVLGLASCTTEKTPEPSGTVDSCITSGQIISYANDIVPILATNCTNPNFGSCHQSDADGGSGFDYTNANNFQAEAEAGNVETFVLGPNATMPLSTTNGPSTITDCDKQKLQAWLDQGFPIDN